jgi:hypothetical protein
MSLTNYADLQTGIQNWLQRQDLNSIIPDFITLFEACANRRLRVRQMEAVTTLTPQTIAIVTGAAANGTAIRLAVNSTTGITAGDVVAVAGILGTTEANASWPVAVPDGTHLDLIGSTFANPYAGGGTVTDTGNVPLPSDYLAWRRLTWLGNPLRDLDYVHPSIITYEYPDVPASPPAKFTIEASTLRVMPQDATQLGLTYYQKIPPLAVTSTNWLMSAHPDLYLFGALAESQGYTLDQDKLALWKSRRDELIDEILRLDAKTRGPAAVMVKAPTP